MNMISTGAFQTEMDASNRQPNIAEKFAAVWEKKNAKAARAGGVSLMALSLAACGSDDSTTTTTTTSTTTTTTTTSVTPVSAQATTGVDTLTGTTAGDNFSAQMDATATLNTAGLLDTFSGGTGSDTLTIINTTANAMSTQITAANITGIEKLVYSATGGGAIDLDTAGSATEFDMTILGATDISDLTMADTLTVVNGGATMNTTITYLATDVANAADADTISVTSVTDGAELDFSGAVETMTLDVNGAARFDNLVFDATTTTINIDAAAALRVDDVLTSAGATSITVTGAGAVTLTPALGALVTTYDASAATGVQTILAGATNATITTGSANDVVDMGATLTASDTINLGEGDDTLRVDIDGLTAGAVDLNITGAETLRLDNTGANDGAIQMDNTTFTSIRFDANTARTGNLTLTGLPTANATFTFKGGGTLDDNPQFNGVVVDYDATAAIAAATINVDNGGKTADDMFMGKFDINLVTAVTVNATEIGQAAADELTMDEIEADNMTDFTMVADGEVIITNIDGNILDTVDFTAADKGVAVTITDSAAAIAITMGDGNDTVTLSDTAAGATIDLGAGNDTFVSNDGIDVITTGTGIDTITFLGDAGDDSNVVKDFTGGAGGDIIDMGASITLALNTGTTTDAVFDTANATGANITLNEGLLAIDFVEVSALDAVTVKAFIQDMFGTGGTAELVFGNSGDNVYMAVDDGTDTGVYLLDAGATDSSGTTVTLIATLEGVEVGDLTAANFADFL